MPGTENLVAGFRAFRATYFEQRPALYEALVKEGQHPEVLMISCSDSRVDPALLLNTQPGELFVVRNVANLVPPYQPNSHYHGTSAALEFAVRDLQVRHAIILGHSGCGGMRALRQLRSGIQPEREFISPWVSIAAEAFEPASREQSDSEAERAMEQAALKVSLGNLRTFPWVRDRVASGELTLHAWWFDLKTGELWALDEQAERFSRIG